MHTHGAEVPPESRLKEGPCLDIERMTWTGEHLSHYSRGGPRFGCPSRYLFARNLFFLFILLFARTTFSLKGSCAVGLRRGMIRHPHHPFRHLVRLALQRIVDRADLKLGLDQERSAAHWNRREIPIRGVEGRLKLQTRGERSEHGLVTVGAMQADPTIKASCAGRRWGRFDTLARGPSLSRGHAEAGVEFVLRLRLLVRLGLAAALFGLAGWGLEHIVIAASAG